MEELRINRACCAYPCHDDLEDCTFPYCPLYPCLYETKGEYTVLNHIWDCSKCTMVHKKVYVDKIFEMIRENEKV